MLNEKISYQIIRSQRKTMSPEIKPDGQIIVRAPLRLSQVRIRRFVEQKQEWILKNLEKIQKREVQRETSSGTFKGRTNPSAAGSLPENSRAHSLFCRKNRVSYGRITLRQQKTRWGSCSANGNLNFNWLLILAPPEVLDYVVVHELCHRRQMNHSQAFWNEVSAVLPGYKEQKKWLKDNGWKLMELGMQESK